MESVTFSKFFMMITNGKKDDEGNFNGEDLSSSNEQFISKGDTLLVFLKYLKYF